MEAGLYCKKGDKILYARNKVVSKNWVIDADTNGVYPQHGWHYFVTLSQAYEFFGMNIELNSTQALNRTINRNKT